IAGRHSPADFLGGGVAALLRLLQPGHMVAAFLVAPNYQTRQGLRIAFRVAPLLQGLNESFRVFANPLDVEHRSASRKKRVTRCGKQTRRAAPYEAASSSASAEAVSAASASSARLRSTKRAHQMPIS